MTFEKAFIAKKLDELVGYIAELDALLKATDEEIFKDSGRLHIAERLLQLIVDTMIDINEHYIRELRFPLTEDFQSTFIILGEHTILPSPFAVKIAPVVGLRNRIVHRYETVDKKLFIELLRKNSRDFKEYVTHITKQI